MNANTALMWTNFVTAEVMAVEATVVGSGQGQTKLQLLLNTIQNATQVGLITAPNVKVAQWTALIGGIVAIMNASGVFKTTAPSPAN